MTQKLALQVSLMILIATSLAVVLILVAGSLAGPKAVDLGQVVPLALASAAAFVIILSSPFERTGR